MMAPKPAALPSYQGATIPALLNQTNTTMQLPKRWANQLPTLMCSWTILSASFKNYHATTVPCCIDYFTPSAM